jgi:hypothetical protein
LIRMQPDAASRGRARHGPVSRARAESDGKVFVAKAECIFNPVTSCPATTLYPIMVSLFLFFSGEEFSLSRACRVWSKRHLHFPDVLFDRFGYSFLSSLQNVLMQPINCVMLNRD